MGVLTSDELVDTEIADLGLEAIEALKWKLLDLDKRLERIEQTLKVLQIPHTYNH